MSKELSLSQSAQYVGPYRLEKTLGKGQTGEYVNLVLCYDTYSLPFWAFSACSASLISACLLFLSFRTGQAWGALHYRSEGSNQNSQQREAV